MFLTDVFKNKKKQATKHKQTVGLELEHFCKINKT